MNPAELATIRYAEIARLRHIERLATAWARAHRATWPVTTMDSRGVEEPYVTRGDFNDLQRELLDLLAPRKAET